MRLLFDDAEFGLAAKDATFDLRRITVPNVDRDPRVSRVIGTEKAWKPVVGNRLASGNGEMTEP